MPAALLVLVLGARTLALTLPSALDARGRTLLLSALIVGSAFAGSGLWVLRRADGLRFGLLNVAMACALFVLTWRLSDVPAAFTAGMVLGAAWIPLLGHIVLTFPSGRLQRRAERRLAASAYV